MDAGGGKGNVAAPRSRLHGQTAPPILFMSLRIGVETAMLRLLIRFLGLLLLAGGFAALIVDGTRSLAGDGLHVTPLSEGAADLFPAQMKAFRIALEEKAPQIWASIVFALLLAPLSLTLTGLGGLLIALSRKRRRAIDYPLR